MCLGGSSRPSGHVTFRLRRSLISVDRMVGAEAMMSDAAGMSGVAELQESLLATDTLQEFLHEVAYRAATEVSLGLSCGLTARSDGRPLTIASSDGYANMLDQLQYRLDQGPCLTTLHTGKVVLDDGTDAGERWPLYRIQGEAVGLGVSLWCRSATALRSSRR